MKRYSFLGPFPFKITVSICALLMVGCGLIQKRDEAGQDPFDIQVASDPAEAKAQLKESGRDVLYGQPLGEATVTVGSIAAFPPYGVYVLGNSLLWLGGYEKIEISDALPENERSAWDKVYTDIVSAPGRVAAAMAGVEFRSQVNLRSNNTFEVYQNVE